MAPTRKMCDTCRRSRADGSRAGPGFSSRDAPRGGAEGLVRCSCSVNRDPRGLLRIHARIVLALSPHGVSLGIRSSSRGDVLFRHHRRRRHSHRFSYRANSGFERIQPAARQADAAALARDKPHAPGNRLAIVCGRNDTGHLPLAVHVSVLRVPGPVVGPRPGAHGHRRHNDSWLDGGLRGPGRCIFALVAGSSVSSIRRVCRVRSLAVRHAPPGRARRSCSAMGGHRKPALADLARPARPAHDWTSCPVRLRNSLRHDRSARNRHSNFSPHDPGSRKPTLAKTAASARDPAARRQSPPGLVAATDA